jgi:hypothetical protein
MHRIVTWLLALVAVVLIVLLVAVARGDEHHHGNDVGALAVTTATG